MPADLGATAWDLGKEVFEHPTTFSTRIIGKLAIGAGLGVAEDAYTWVSGEFRSDALLDDAFMAPHVDQKVQALESYADIKKAQFDLSATILGALGGGAGLARSVVGKIRLPKLGAFRLPPRLSAAFGRAWKRWATSSGSGDPVASAEGPRLLTGTVERMADHHLFPRQFAEFFKARGISIDDFTITVPHNTTHLRGIHGKGLGNMPGRWNQRWADFIEANPAASTTATFQFAGRMMDDYGLSGFRIHPYKQ